MKNPQFPRGSSINIGSVLLSQRVAPQVPSTLVDLTTMVRTNYEILLADNITIKNYIKNMNPLMQIKGIKNYLNLID